MDPKLGICLWFDGKAEEATRLYADTLPDTHVNEATRSTMDWPGGKEGDVITVDFTLMGTSALALSGGPGEDHTNAMSLIVLTDDQDETDRYWKALLAGGGQEFACGWLADRFGARWQITPRVLMEGTTHPDPETRARVMSAMVQMVKIDHAQIEAAIAGDAG